MAVRNQEITDHYAIYNGDCIETMKPFKNESIHFSIYSPPFGGLYHYSSDMRDLSNSYDYDQFFEHYAFVIAEISRLTISGRCTAVHCTDIPTGNSGHDHLIDFPGDIIRLHEKHDFNFIARHMIWKEPLWVRNRTMAKALAHKTIVDDAAYAGVASADYLLIFRKKGQNKIPIEHPYGLSTYYGGAPIPNDLLRYKNYQGNQIENKYSHWIWRQYASSIWDDIRMDRVLPFKHTKEPNDESHVHPLQLDIIDRAILLRTNLNEVVFSPFAGIGSEVYCAIKRGRKGVGIELKTAYYNQMLLNCKNAVKNPEENKQSKLL